MAKFVLFFNRLLLAGGMLMALVQPARAAPTGPTYVITPPPVVFINEIHYDNEGGDTGEAVEIAAPTGTDLSEASVVFYNDGGREYASEDLAEVAGQCGDYDLYVVNIPGFQNGAADGLALVNTGTGVVKQLLSYEGTLTAVDGPAAGLTSTDIGVAESGSTPVGDSLQLTGTGSTYNDFTWAAAQPSTFGACNTGQTLVAPVTLVTLRAFHALRTVDGVAITWETGVEVNNAGFNLYRGGDADGPWHLVNAALIPALAAPGQGATYEYLDGEAGFEDGENGTLFYLLEDVEVDGVATRHGPFAAAAEQTGDQEEESNGAEPIHQLFIPQLAGS